MYLKKHYVKDDAGNLSVSHVEVLRKGQKQNFTQKFINQAMKDGYLTISKGTITIHAKPEDLVYKIVRVPGYYCTHDNAPLSGHDEAMKYLEDKYHGIPSPCANNPAGYRKDNFFHCELQGVN